LKAAFKKAAASANPVVIVKRIVTPDNRPATAVTVNRNPTA
jgi:hypothetical protein